MTHRCLCLLASWGLGIVLWAEAERSSSAHAHTPPAELQAWLAQTATPHRLPPGSYPLDHLVGVLPPHAPQFLATEVTNGTPLSLDVVTSPVFAVLVSDRVHQLNANGELSDTTRCGLELPFPGLSSTADRAGLKAVWNMLCRNRGGLFEVLGSTLRGSGPNPHRAISSNLRYGYGPQGVGSISQTLSPPEQKGNQSATWVPWRRDGDESLYLYQDEMRRVRRASTIRGDKFAGTNLTREQFYGWEGQFFVYDWTVLGERPVLAVIDSRQEFPRYLPLHRWVPDDHWALRSSLLLVGKRAHRQAGSGYVALWLDLATYEPLWGLYYRDDGTAHSLLVTTLKWNAEHKRHVMIGGSVVDLDTSGPPVAGTVYEVAFCRNVHQPAAFPADASSYSGLQLGKGPLNWREPPSGCR
jgi:hypothetical protein